MAFFMGFLRYFVGTILVIAGAVLMGGYLAIQLANPASWEGASPNPAIRFFQSSFFIMGAKSPQLLILFGAGGAALALGSFLIRAVNALLYAASLACLAVLGGAAIAQSAAPAGAGKEPLLNVVEGGRDMARINGKDAGIIAGLGFSILLIVLFMNIWKQLRSGKGGKGKSKSKATASAAED